MKEPGRARCFRCGKYFLCMSTREAHEFLAHGSDPCRPEFGEPQMTTEIALAHVDVAELEAKEVRKRQSAKDYKMPQVKVWKIGKQVKNIS